MGSPGRERPRLAGSSFYEIQAPLDATKPLVKSIHALAHGTQENQGLSLHLLQCRYATLDVGQVELGSLLRRTNATKHLEKYVVPVFDHGSYSSNPGTGPMLALGGTHVYSASAPEMISISSLVIMAWRVRL